MSDRRSPRVAALSLLMLTLALAVGLVSPLQRLSAHEIPADVTVRAFVKPDGAVLRVLVRVPLATFRDVIIPTRGEVMLDLANADGAVRAGADLWIAGGLRVFEGTADLGRARLVGTRVSLPSDGAFESWERATAHLTGPRLDPATELVWTQALVDVSLEVPITDERARFSLETDYARLGLRTQTIIQFLPPEGTPRVFQFFGDAGRVDLDPGWFEAARRFVASGIKHILIGADHLLFLLCLVIPVRRFTHLLLIVTAFTVAHSITLVAAASGWVPQGLWFAPFVETLIAASIIWMAFENIVGVTSMRRRWILTAAFGLVHGFGFAFVLEDMLQFGGRHVATSLVAFNVGVEIGQVAALLVLLPCLWLLFRFVVPERIGGILISAVVAHQAWHWMEERWTDLLAHDIPAPTVTFVLRAAILLWIVGGLVWLVKMRGLSRQSQRHQ